MSDPLFEAVQDVNASYRAARTGYEKPDEFIDDTITPVNLRPHVTRGIVGFLLASVGGFLIACCLGCISYQGSSTAESFLENQESVDAFYNAFLTFSAVMGLVWIAWVVSLFFRIREPIAEYSLLVEGRAMAASSAYGFVLRAAQARSTPFPLHPVRISGQYWLRLGDERLQSLIVVQTYGTDLYVGWTMWRSRSTIVVIWHIIRDLFRIFAGGTAYRSALQNTHARALREITHSLTRLGVQAAVLNVQAPPDVAHLVSQVPEVSLDQVASVAPPPIQPPTQSIPTDPSGQQYFPPGAGPVSAPPGSVSGPPSGPFGPPVSGPPTGQYGQQPAPQPGQYGQQPGQYGQPPASGPPYQGPFGPPPQQ